MEAPVILGQTISVNDIEMYYEIRGEGVPLILLHGGGGIGANWNLVFPAPPDGYRWRWEAMVTTGVRSDFVASQLAARQMVQARRGLIVHVSYWAAQKYIGNVLAWVDTFHMETGITLSETQSAEEEAKAVEIRYARKQGGRSSP